jgi:hypothetical protein
LLLADDVIEQLVPDAADQPGVNLEGRVSTLDGWAGSEMTRHLQQSGDDRGTASW